MLSRIIMRVVEVVVVTLLTMFLIVVVATISSCSRMVTDYKKCIILGAATTHSDLFVLDMETGKRTAMSNKEIHNNYLMGVDGYGKGDTVRFPIGQIKLRELKRRTR